MTPKKTKKLPRPNLTFKIKPKREEEKLRSGRYQGRLMYWMGSLKKMLKIRYERINEIEKEKTEIGFQIIKLKKQIEEKTKYQTELREHITGLEKELNIYRDYFLKIEDGFGLDKKPTFFIKTQKNKSGNTYYVGRVRFFQRNHRKRREKWVYFGSVLELNRKYGKGVDRDKVEEVVKDILLGELKEKFKGVYF